jgi:regulator of protease activity HflC (stomatin/prohibitin superfamily)
MDTGTIAAEFVGALVFIALFWVLYGYPRWRVWAAHQRGLADLTQAKNEQQIQIAQANSRLQAAELNKQAAIIEAQAVSEQIKTIGEQLTSHGLFLRWQWIEMMKNHSDKSTIYVATEGSLPILEAARLQK